MKEDFAIPVDHRVKIKESEKRDKYLNLARELKSLWNMKVTVITNIFGIFEMVLNGVEKRLGGLEIRQRIKTTAQLKSASIL